MNKLHLRTNIENKGSQAIAKKCGFILEGTHKEDFKDVNGNFVDIFRKHGYLSKKITLENIPRHSRGYYCIDFNIVF